MQKQANDAKRVKPRSSIQQSRASRAERWLKDHPAGPHGEALGKPYGTERPETQVEADARKRRDEAEELARAKKARIMAKQATSPTTTVTQTSIVTTRVTGGSFGAGEGRRRKEEKGPNASS